MRNWEIIMCSLSVNAIPKVCGGGENDFMDCISKLLDGNESVIVIVDQIQKSIFYLWGTFLIHSPVGVKIV